MQQHISPVVAVVVIVVVLAVVAFFGMKVMKPSKQGSKPADYQQQMQLHAGAMANQATGGPRGAPPSKEAMDAMMRGRSMGAPGNSR